MTWCTRTTELTRTTDILRDLIAFPTVSSRSNLAMIDYLANVLDDLGARITLVHDDTGSKANLFATLGPEEQGGIVLSGHSDVVPVEGQRWSRDPFTMYEDQGLLYGRGSCDMKGFIASTLAMAPHYAKQSLRRPVHFSFTYDEETGCLGASKLIEELIRLEYKPAIAIIGEPTEMRVIEGHKGCHEYITTFSGLAGHGSNPDAGVNAVQYAVRYISRMMELGERLQDMAPQDSAFEPPWTTVQVGRMHGGTAHNIIPWECEVEWEMRPVQDGDAEYVKEQLNQYCQKELLPAMQAIHAGSSIEMRIGAEVPGLIPMVESEAKELVTALTGAHTAGLVAFGTEAGLFQNMGVSPVVCGPGSIAQAHKADEYISMTQLQSCLDMLEALHGTLAGDSVP